MCSSRTAGARAVIGRAAGRVRIVALLRFFVHGVHFPAAAVGIRRPHFGLLSVTARLFALDLRFDVRRLQPSDRRIDGICAESTTTPKCASLAGFASGFKSSASSNAGFSVTNSA